MTHAPPTSVIGFTIGKHNYVLAWTAETTRQARDAMGKIAKKHKITNEELMEMWRDMDAVEQEDNS